MIMYGILALVVIIVINFYRVSNGPIETVFQITNIKQAQITSAYFVLNTKETKEITDAKQIAELVQYVGSWKLQQHIGFSETKPDDYVMKFQLETKKGDTIIITPSSPLVGVNGEEYQLKTKMQKQFFRQFLQQ